MLLRSPGSLIALALAACGSVLKVEPLVAQTLERVHVIPLDDHVITPRPFTPATWFVGTGLAVATDDQSILLVGREGTLRGSWGRKGQGPGEFEQVLGLGVSGDTLVAYDGSTRRLTARLRDGSLVTTAVQPPRDAQPPLEPLGLAAGSLVYGIPGPSVPSRQASNIVLVVRASGDGASVDTVGALDTSNLSTRIQFEGGSLTLFQPFVHRDHVAIDPTGQWLVIVRPPSSQFHSGTDGVRIDALGPAGPLTAIAPHRPVPLSDASVRRWLDERSRTLARRFTSEASARSAIAERLLRPDHHPPVRRALVGHDGTVWWLHSPLDARADQWGVIDLRTRRITSVSLPANSHPLVVAADGAWVLEEDTDGEQILVRYRIRATP
jgi:hypothetical protein